MDEKQFDYTLDKFEKDIKESFEEKSENLTVVDSLGSSEKRMIVVGNHDPNKFKQQLQETDKKLIVVGDVDPNFDELRSAGFDLSEKIPNKNDFKPGGFLYMMDALTNGFASNLIDREVQKMKDKEAQKPKPDENCKICGGRGTIPQRRLSGKVRNIPCYCNEIRGK